MYIMNKDLKLQDWEFSQRKHLPYEIKLRLSATRIREWYEYYGGDVYISFSGGLDSTVLVHMVERVLDRSIPKVFVDTGLEFPQIREFVRGFYDVEILYPEMNFKDVLLTYGYPLISKEVAAKIRKLRHGNLSERYRNYLLHGDERGKLGKLSECWKFLIDAPFDISEYCCIVMKEKPLTEYAKRTGRVPYIGITQDEGFMRQRQYNRTGCNVYLADKPKSQPLGFWPRQDILRYVVENNLRICPVYGKICGEKGAYYNTGEQRTGCIYSDTGCNEDAETEQFHKAYMEFLDKCGVDGFVRKFYENEEELMKEVVCYTDSATLGILLNEKLTTYNALKKQSLDLIQAVCKEEDLHISRLEHDIWMPFWVCFAEEKKECDGEEYGIFLLGSDGYNYYGYDRFDPTWVCKTFVMDQLLDIALKKLEAYTAAPKMVA